jgi:hypothetical protein
MCGLDDQQGLRESAYLRWRGRNGHLWDDWRDWFEAVALLRREWKPGWREAIEAIAYQKWCQQGQPSGRALEFWVAAQHEAIEAIAYHKWCQVGRPVGMALEFWVAAEHEVTEAIAYHKWCQAGRPAGRALEFWLAAEREVRGTANRRT